MDDAITQLRSDVETSLRGWAPGPLGRALNELGYALYVKGELEAARQELEEALSCRRDAVDVSGEAITLNNLGLVLSAQGEYESARIALRLSIQLRRKVWDNDGEIRTLLNVAQVEDKRGDDRSADDAITCAMTVAAKAVAVDPKVQETLGMAVESRGDLQNALSWYQRAATVARAKNDPDVAMTASIQAARLQIDSGMFAQAIETLESVRAVVEIAPVQTQVEYRIALAGPLAALGRFEEAQNEANRAVEVSDPGSRAHTLNAVGCILAAADDHGAAVANFENAAQAAHKLGYGKTEAIALANSARSLLELARPEDALARAERASKIARAHDSPDTLGFCRFIEATATFAVGHLADAAQCYREAIDVVEEVFGSLGWSELHAVYSGSLELWFEMYLEAVIELIASDRKSELAGSHYRLMFEIVERNKSRTLAKLLSLARPSPVFTSEDDRERLTQEKALLSELRQLGRALATHSGPGATQLLAKRSSLVRNLKGLWDQLARTQPEYVALRRGRVASLPEAKAFADSHNAALVQIYVLQDSTLVIVVAPNLDSPLIYVAPVDQELLERGARNVSREIASFPSVGRLQSRWHSHLKDVLLPALYVLEEFGGTLPMVYLFPHGILHGIPLHALPMDDGEPLIRRSPVVYAPSATVLCSLAARPPHTARSRPKEKALVVGFADPPSERTQFEEEARVVAGLLGAEPLLGDDAKVETVSRRAQEAEVVHFSCHGVFDPNDPLNSGIELADGRWTARDILNAKINAALVSVSACKTGLSDRAAGDELTGLSRALLESGASAVLVSLWDVEIASARELMVQYYRRMLADEERVGAANASALQEAILDLRAQHSHEFYWAPFVAVGLWRRP